MSHRAFFEQQKLVFAEEAKRKVDALRQNDRLVDSMPEEQIRAWLRYLVNENFRLQTDNERLIEIIARGAK